MRILRVMLMLASGLLVVLLLMWMSGKFHAKVPAVAEQGRSPSIEGEAVPARLVKMPVTESAVGSVQAVHETTIAANYLGTSSVFLLSKVIEVNVKAGQVVKKNDVLLRLDDTNPKTKLEQARSSLQMADAAYKQAVIDEKRLGTLLKGKAVSQQEYDKASTRLKSTEADLKRSQEVVNESQAILDYATILAPMNGIVIDKKVDVGDTVAPGQTLLKLVDPTRMQLVANVRESLVPRLKVGQDIAVRIGNLDKACTGTISEIVPESSSTSRTFLVKVTGPCPKGVHSGMFGRILIPLDDEQVLVIPSKAVGRTGQIEIVDVIDNGRPVRRAIRTGRTFGDDVEALSGLREGERVVVPAGMRPEGAVDAR